MPQLPGTLPYCVTVAYGSTCQIDQFEYANLADARLWFETLCADSRTISATLAGPDDETLADYDRRVQRTYAMLQETSP